MCLPSRLLDGLEDPASLALLQIFPDLSRHTTIQDLTPCTRCCPPGPVHPTSRNPVVRASGSAYPPELASRPPIGRRNPRRKDDSLALASPALTINHYVSIYAAEVTPLAQLPLVSLLTLCYGRKSVMTAHALSFPRLLPRFFPLTHRWRQRLREGDMAHAMT